MATSLTQPRAISQPWANSGDKATVPDTTATLGVASLAEGIPPECSLPIGSGGAYVRRTDVNALGNLTTDHLYFQQNGGYFTFVQAVSDAIGGYPTGAKLWATVSGQSVLLRSLKDNNTSNFVTTPSFINDGVNWTYDLPSNIYLFKYSGATVFTGSMPITNFADLNLSGTVGTNRAFVHLQVSPDAAIQAVSFRPKGESKGVGVDIAGTPTGTSGAGSLGSATATMFLSLITDASGVVQWKSSAAGLGGTVVKVLAYQVLA